ncbi:Uncharacterized protein TCM_037556 [Theobroma cacao]|uniref:Uncharacterized protein n=1 Tax=Theobroma cacao TaxID=3641 RepID=A0A061GLM6_THECC|nr:Uncharacterized protein TCM_037556 [Theobroma cacao]
MITVCSVRNAMLSPAYENNCLLISRESLFDFLVGGRREMGFDLYRECFLLLTEAEPVAGKATGVTKRRSGAPCGQIWPLRRQIGASPRLDLAVECQIQPWDLVGKHQIRCFPLPDLAVECQIWPNLRRNLGFGPLGGQRKWGCRYRRLEEGDSVFVWEGRICGGWLERGSRRL